MPPTIQWRHARLLTIFGLPSSFSASRSRSEIYLNTELGIAGNQDLRGDQPGRAGVRGAQGVHVAPVQNVEHVNTGIGARSAKLQSLRGPEVDALLGGREPRPRFNELDRGW